MRPLHAEADAARPRAGTTVSGPRRPAFERRGIESAPIGALSIPYLSRPWTTKQVKVSVERVCFLGRVRPERLDEYRERHEDVWPEMREALAKAGWSNYSLFLTEDGLLVGYLETDDYQIALNAMGATDVNKRWQAEMAGYFVPDGPPDQSFLRIAEIFHLD